MSLKGRQTGRKINAGFDSPVEYTPTPAGNESTDKISAHNKGIDNELGNVRLRTKLTGQTVDGGVAAGGDGAYHGTTEAAASSTA